MRFALPALFILLQQPLEVLCFLHHASWVSRQVRVHGIFPGDNDAGISDTFESLKARIEDQGVSSRASSRNQKMTSLMRELIAASSPSAVADVLEAHTALLLEPFTAAVPSDESIFSMDQSLGERRAAYTRAMVARVGTAKVSEQARALQMMRDHVLSKVDAMLRETE